MEEVIKIDNEIYDKLLDMSLSNDTSNHIVVKGILDNINVEENIIYILCLYKEINSTYKNGIFNDLKDKIVEFYPKIVTDSGHYASFTWDEVYDYALTLQNKDLISAVSYRYSKNLQSTLEQVGYKFLKKYNLTLVPKE